MANADKRKRRVILDLSLEEAQILQALLYSRVGGVGRIRGILTDYDQSIQNALESALGYASALVNTEGQITLCDCSSVEYDAR